MADKLIFGVTFDSAGDPDSVKRTLTTVVGDAAPVVTDYPAGKTDLGDIMVEQDSNVHLELVDTDDAGNKSEPVVLDFVAVDTLPPQLSGVFGVTLKGEVDDTPDPNQRCICSDRAGLSAPARPSCGSRRSGSADRRRANDDRCGYRR
jgi:hypothetical protein